MSMYHVGVKPAACTISSEAKCLGVNKSGQDQHEALPGIATNWTSQNLLFPLPSSVLSASRSLPLLFFF